MKVFLDQEIGVGKTRVMNFGRVSNGILQMMKSAAQKATELKPDLLIIAFLTRDMERPLRYVSPLNIAGTIRQYMHHERDELPDFLRAQEMGQIDARAAQELGSDEEVDFLRDVRARYATVLRRLSGRMFRLRDMHRSVLLDELVTGTVFTAFDLPPLDYKPTIRSIDVTSYDQNSEFQEIFDTLNACDVPVIFVHLPEAQEMKTKTFVPHSAVGGQLLGSFKKLIKKPVYFLSQYIDLPPEEIDKKFDHTDYDFHPSLWTKTVYADLITQLVLNECKANETMRSKAGLNNVA
ncbi:MAG: hypothetical protein LCH56_14145 [Proteobacteria bacterium]|nr:hypothetical protein [Pseudomonadota bacterium]